MALIRGAIALKTTIIKFQEIFMKQTIVELEKENDIRKV